MRLSAACWDGELTNVSQTSVKEGKGFIAFVKMQGNVCIAGSETVLAVSSLRIPLFLLLTNVSDLINLESKLFITIDYVQF